MQRGENQLPPSPLSHSRRIEAGTKSLFQKFLVYAHRWQLLPAPASLTGKNNFLLWFLPADPSPSLLFSCDQCFSGRLHHSGFEEFDMQRFFHSTPRLWSAFDKSHLGKLRKKTGYTFSNCKKALEVNGNDYEKVFPFLSPLFTLIFITNYFKVTLICVNFNSRLKSGCTNKPRLWDGQKPQNWRAERRRRVSLESPVRQKRPLLWLRSTVKLTLWPGTKPSGALSSRSPLRVCTMQRVFL